MKNVGLLLVAITISLCLPLSLQAKPKEARAEKKAECHLISSRTAITNAQQRVEGKVVSIKLHGKGKNAVYRVRMLVGEKRIKNLTIKACR